MRNDLIKTKIREKDVFKLLDEDFIKSYPHDDSPSFEQKAHLFLTTLRKHQPIHIAQLSRKLKWCQVSVRRYTKVFGFAINTKYVGRNKTIKLKNKYVKKK